MIIASVTNSRVIYKFVVRLHGYERCVVISRSSTTSERRARRWWLPHKRQSSTLFLYFVIIQWFVYDLSEGAEARRAAPSGPGGFCWGWAVTRPVRVLGSERCKPETKKLPSQTHLNVITALPKPLAGWAAAFPQTHQNPSGFRRRGPWTFWLLVR